ncbi:MAG: ATP-dependent DNA helicase RecG [Cytophagia bacterium]|nr:ATP-dependent DNA helicase RecG [Cytophagia bacterium]NBW38385.1 ATP-dependent DNA helicase RecG [Cytophagia bacterium]
MADFFSTSIEYLKGVGPQRAALLNKELSVFTYADLLQHYPFRYEDRTKFYKINEIVDEMPYVQVRGIVKGKELIGNGFKKRLAIHFEDETGSLELVWFQGINWANEKIKIGTEYIVFGKPARFGSKFSIAHPEIDVYTETTNRSQSLRPVYPLTEKLKSKHLDNKVISRLQQEILTQGKDLIRETLPVDLLQTHALVGKKEAMINIHFPRNTESLNKAQQRIKFEELFYVQLKLLQLKHVRKVSYKGQVFNDSSLLTEFYKNHLPFDLTDAQKRVIKEIYADMKTGRQMNRLLQGDVGSGKTIVGFICMLLAIGSHAQCALMAPTEILAQQHFTGLKRYAEKMNLSIEILTGSTKKSERKIIHEKLLSGELKILVGTHALLEDVVQFKNLGLAVIDEQHRFGVAQRSKLWKKNEAVMPHVLVMTATPIPRTLAMTLYGDLDISVIDQLPAGRKPIKTVHRYDSHRLAVNQFLREQIALGRQVYVVYPLIEESEKLDLKHLMDGYESMARAFPDVALSIVHGQMKAADKEYEMQRFKKGETKIMVATTVIEVGVDVPNASVMVIENAERFGLSQLHQLRGRVGRGAEQSFCILMSNYKLSQDSKVRLNTMVQTNNGFEIAETDLKLRGPGDLTGTQQSGVLDLLLADLSKDQILLQQARESAISILESDPNLEKIENACIKNQVATAKKSGLSWSKIS